MLTPAQFAKLFPFHFVLDREMRIVSIGPVLARLCPSAVVGAPFSLTFALHRIGLENAQAFDRDLIREQQATLFIFKTTDSRLLMRCQVMLLEDPERYVFLGSPWVRRPNELAALKLTLADFALHDSTVDLLQHVQTAYVSVRDAKELAARLELQRDDLQGMIEFANAPIVGVDLTGRIEEWNRAAESRLGVTKPEALGSNFLARFVDRGSRASAAQLLAEGSSGRACGDLECNLKTADDKLVLMLLSGSPRHGPDGQVVGTLMVGQNITSLGEYRAELEKQVSDRTAELEKANDQLSSALRAKDDFLSAMSHELRTPLNAILGLSESMVDGVYGHLNEKQTRSLNTIAESGHHLLSLINDLLDLAKVGAGKMELDLMQVSVAAACESSVRLVTEQANKKGITIGVALDPIVTTVVTDSRRLTQVLVNLLSNAVKFTHDRGRIELEVHGDTDERTVAIGVSDTGIGISADDLARLFVPFTQIDSKLSRLYPGTGLGLTLVRRLTDVLGGDLAVASEVGVGSRFTVVLPWDPPTHSGAADTEQAGAKFDAHGGAMGEESGPLILVVDDDLPSQTTVRDYLCANGFRVETANNGAEGVRVARLRHPQVILMDLQMPVMDGFAAMRELRGTPSFEATAIIALTSKAMPEDRAACLAAGATAYLSKPVALRDLVSTIRSALPNNPQP